MLIICAVVNFDEVCAGVSDSLRVDVVVGVGPRACATHLQRHGGVSGGGDSATYLEGGID